MKKLNYKSIGLMAVLIALFTPVTSLAIAVCGVVGATLLSSNLSANSLFAIITPADLTFNGEELKSLQEATFEDVYTNPEISKFHKVVPSIKAQKQIAIMGLLSMVGKSGKGCDPTSDTATIGMSEKFWTPAKNSIRLEACGDDLLDTFFVWGTNNGVEKADLTSTDFMNFVQERLKFANLESLFRIAWFGDVDHATVTDSPAGVLTTGTDVTMFNHINGIWNQIYSIVASDSTKKVAISRNGQSTFANQNFDSTDTTNKVVSGYLQSMRFGADYRLREKANLVYVCTQSVADQYEKELLNANVAYTTERLENGMTVLKSGGIQVIGWNLWDRIIRTNFSDGTKYYQPHRIVLTTTDNIQIGLEDANSFAGMDVFYDKKSKKNFIDVEYTLDAKLVQDELVMVAY
jgi:hypothetical protein